MKFSSLIQTIQQTHNALQQQAVSAVNRYLTIRNWLIGFYIVEFEQNGEDRAGYGKKLIESLAKKLANKSLSNGNLKVFRQFYLAYPQIRQSVIGFLYENPSIRQSVIGELQANEIGQLVTAKSVEHLSSMVHTAPKPLLETQLYTPPDKLISKLSFTHLTLLLPVTDPLKRTFYELECMKGNWSVRQLKRQINSLYFERSAISKKPELLSQLVQSGMEPLAPEHIIKDVYTFEFLGLPLQYAVEENQLETALLDHLQEFIIELGRGFCFEARQQRILIGDEYFFIDLVFYHRILKCHVLIDLKVEEFSHANAGQLNTYLNYYKAEVMQKADNPPVGILMVTNKNDALVEYATAGMDQKLFVKKYQLALPTKEQLESFIKQELKNAAQ